MKTTMRGLALTAALLAALLAAAGCNNATTPQAGRADGAAAIDPGAGTFALKTVECESPAGGLVRLSLLGSDLALDADGEHVELTVALRNDDERPLPGPALVWLLDFDPASVFLAEPDTSLPVGSILPVDGFIYDDEFGGDGVLSPGEVSTGRTWRFRTPAQEPFSFAVSVTTPAPPTAARLAGMCFWDADRDGHPDFGEGPVAPGEVIVTEPDGARTSVLVGEAGRWEHPLRLAGLHTVEFLPWIETFAPIAFSTPNPRQVMITTGPDGELLGFERAHFGVVNALRPGPPPVRFSDAPPDSLHQVPWRYVDAHVRDGMTLVLDVGFSGCGPDHAFSLWMSGGVRESQPPQVVLVPVHETDEECDAYWRREMAFDLGPLAARLLTDDGPGEVILDVVDFGGERHQLTWRLGFDRPHD